MIENRMNFFTDASATADSEIMVVNKANILTIEVVGAGTFSLDVKATVGIDEDNFTTIQGVKLNDFTVVGSITSAGIYEFDITNVSKVQVSLGSVSGGTVSVAGVTRSDV